MNLSSFVLLITAIITMFVVSKNSASISTDENFILDDTMKTTIQQEMISRNFVYKNDDGSYHINDLNVHGFVEMQNNVGEAQTKILSSGNIVNSSEQQLWGLVWYSFYVQEPPQPANFLPGVFPWP